MEVEPRESIVVEITRRLLDYLIGGADLSPGDRIPSERQLARDIGVGRSPVREALKTLSVMGILEVRQGDGTYLKRPDSELLPRVIEWGLLLGEQRVVDLVEARQIIEVATCRLAAERRDADDISALQQRLGEMKAAAEASAFVEADVAFHLRVAEAARNTALRSVLVSLQSLLRVWIQRAVDVEHGFEIPITEHELVLRAIEDGNPDAATVAMTTHMSNAAKRLAESISESAAADLVAPGRLGAPNLDGTTMTSR